MTHATLSSPLAVPIANSELRQLHSSTVGQDYFIKIRLPERYAETTTSYPVLYLLDGDHAFAMATDILQYLIYGGYTPDMIIVSPAYGSKDTPRNGGTNMRGRDLIAFETHFASQPPGGEQFLAFLKQELIPYVEQVYRIDGSERTLWGYSAGALFALYALFREPKLFQKYIVVDGFYDTLLEIEENYATNNSSLAAKLFLAGGSDLLYFHERLKDRRHNGLEVVYEPLSELGHFAIPAEGLTKGLIAVYRDEVNRD